ncbi:Molybdopterin synthase catalytic subunit MoaE [hydrothermal vent metagenome]|uniref:Molybdopterin synthase catalytic subunit MoaE n=1 Tax=hydrothermal vent metagenome TaxID=652676 RepID=A0A3B1A0X1_9ZZZZ
MTVYIKNSQFEPFNEVQQHQQQLEAGIGKGQYGASIIFIGSMRDFNEAHAVSAMTLEYYPGMTESALELICKEAKEKWPILDALIVHRVGDIQPNDSIVLVAVWSAHRAAAYEANRYIMEALKSRAPFWKKETTATGGQWVEKNTPA